MATGVGKIDWEQGQGREVGDNSWELRLGNKGSQQGLVK